jgi:alkylation response protein AidB-like acyl-CoA dehydrogenase
VLDFELSEEQRLMQKMVRELSEKVIAPRAAETDRTGDFPRENFVPCSDGLDL